MAYVLVDSCAMKKPSPIEVAVARLQLGQNCAAQQEHDADEDALVQTECPGRKRVRSLDPVERAAQPRTRRQRCSDEEIEADDYCDDRGELDEQDKQRAVMATILELLQAAIVQERITRLHQ